MINNPEGKAIHIPKFGELKIAANVHVPEKLRPDQNLLDQPPYTWLAADPAILPVDFFSTEEGEPIFIRLVTKYDLTTLSYEHRQFLFQHLDPRYASIEEASKYHRKARAFLEEFPYGVDYLQEKWLQYVHFDRKGDPTQTIWQGQTYAAYAATKLSGELARQTGKWAGLEELLPYGPETGSPIPQSSQLLRSYPIYRINK